MVGIVIGNAAKTVYAVLLTSQANRSGDPLVVERIYRLYTCALNAGPTITTIFVPSLHSFGPFKLFEGAYIGTSFYLCFGTSFLVMFSALAWFWYKSSGFVNAGKPESTNSPIVKIYKTVRNGLSNKRRYTVLSASPSSPSFMSPSSLMPRTSSTSSFLSAVDNEEKQALVRKEHSDSFLSFCDEEYQDVAEDIFKTWHLYAMFLVLLPPYMLAFQSSTSSFVIQANWMEYPPWFAPESIIFLNCLFSIMAGPTIDVIITFLQAQGIFYGPHKRISFGFITMGIGYLYMAFVHKMMLEQGTLRNGILHSSISIAYQIPGHFLSGYSSVLLTSSSLEYAYLIAPAYMKTIVVSLYFLSMSLGSILGALLSPLVTAEKLGVLFAAIGCSLVALTFLYYYLFKKYDASYYRRNEVKQSQTLQGGSEIEITLTSET